MRPAHCTWILLPLLITAMLPSRPAYAQATGPQTGASRAAALEPTAEPAEAAIRFDLVAGGIDHRINRLIDEMTLDEKIGQLVQLYPEGDQLTDELRARIRGGLIGSVFFAGEASLAEDAQREASASRLGIPLIIARDVVHGFRTIMPIPLGQAATWNPELVRDAARLSALEAKAEGVDWTFAPMVDVCRDPRWGRVAETLGEDPRLASDLAAAMVDGFQLERDGKIHGVAACVKHFAAYGLSEGGRDYNRVSLSEYDLFNTYLPPFRAALDAGCLGLMTTFSEVNGVPGTAHDDLINGVAKGAWRFDGVVVSDWASVTEMVNHGFVPDNRAAARAAVNAGVDMDMCSPAYADHLKGLVAEGQVSERRIDDAVRRVLRMKVALQGGATGQPAPTAESRQAARRLARQSMVLLKNKGVLPLDEESLATVAVIGPMADKPVDQLGCWSLDADAEHSITPLAHLRKRLEGQAEVVYAAGAESSFAKSDDGIMAALAAARQADAVLLFVGEEVVLSGEARSRAELSLPGVQPRLVEEMAALDKPIVMVVMAGRPLAIEREAEAVDAVLYAWHPGSMAGPAIADLLFGVHVPSGRLPITFPRSVGQVPLYYARHNTGRPAPEDYAPLVGSGAEDLPQEFQYRSHYVDKPPTPLYPFGFGLSYTTFEYDSIELSHNELPPSGVLGVRARLTNTGDREAAEIAQLYLRDRVASVVRPVRQLHDHRRVTLKPGESVVLEFAVAADELGFVNNQRDHVIEPGEFDVWVGGDSNATLHAEFRLLEGEGPSAEVASPAVSAETR
ncbi:Periplasmic beta-glucosidase precursor [Posidoniimonas corsicana]|uniref:beta-glucosidase n=1 Tax=Posidoniimonas corsicana TaxID=1938618 RepID=A0A5C5UUI6_9BACT|nr:beta-glucosidase BglX [Posidoniimonas corsicana]TWT29190.1 Periplasmic beta-glucosidase precursor [Posidoniimonas corsicana]